MLEWKPKLLTVILAVVIVVAILGLVHVGPLSLNAGNFQWGAE